MKNTWIELDLDVLGGNLKSVRAALKPGAEIIFVVKSNAYGHGLVPVARHAWTCGVRHFAVAHIEEALSLRALLPEARILVVGALDPSDAPTAAEQGLIAVLVSARHAEALSRVAEGKKARLQCHAKIDTGMGRLGFPWEQAPDLLASVAQLPGLDLRGICSHFASSDGPDRTFAELQAERFGRVLDRCRTLGLTLPFKHIANSGALVRAPAWDLDGVRSGILLYGYGRHPERGGTCAADTDRGIATRPFLHWKTRVIQIKKVPAGFAVGYDSTFRTDRATHIATLNTGYADGYPRFLSNRGFVLAGGRRHPVVGRVSMNLTCIDLGPDTPVREGDEAVLLGAQGNEVLWADEIARWCDTIPYEILTGIQDADRRAG
jgi:alanine racemase